MKKDYLSPHKGYTTYWSWYYHTHRKNKTNSNDFLRCKNCDAEFLQRNFRQIYCSNCVFKIKTSNKTKDYFKKHRTEIYKKLLKNNREECSWCKTKNNLTINHKIPIIAGGENNIENLEFMCKKCNSNHYHGLVKSALLHYFECLSTTNPPQ